ncbi:hypothetical protein AGMMS49975_21600 [Clostridia bacterium]|nr:hypothetical protein AGMMS49975_21600 [Clostridia bacterium]
MDDDGFIIDDWEDVDVWHDFQESILEELLCKESSFFYQRRPYLERKEKRTGVLVYYYIFGAALATLIDRRNEYDDMSEDIEFNGGNLLHFMALDFHFHKLPNVLGEFGLRHGEELQHNRGERFCGFVREHPAFNLLGFSESAIARSYAHDLAASAIFRFIKHPKLR